MEGLALFFWIALCVFVFSASAGIWVISSVLVRGFDQIIKGMQSMDAHLAEIAKK